MCVCVCVCVQVCLFIFDCVKVYVCAVGVVHLHEFVLMYLTQTQHVLAWYALHYTFGPITMHTCVRVCICVCVCTHEYMFGICRQTLHWTLPLYGVPQQKAETWCPEYQLMGNGMRGRCHTGENIMECTQQGLIGLQMVGEELSIVVLCR